MKKKIVLLAVGFLAVLVYLIFLISDKKSTADHKENFVETEVGKSCVRAGCSGELCVEATAANDLMTTCEFKPEYACYQEATCTFLEDGSCGFLQTPQLLECLENASQEVFSEELY